MSPDYHYITLYNSLLNIPLYKNLPTHNFLFTVLLSIPLYKMCYQPIICYIQSGHGGHGVMIKVAK